MLVTTSCFSPLHIFIARMNSNDYKVPPVLSDEEYYDVWAACLSFRLYQPAFAESYNGRLPELCAPYQGTIWNETSTADAVAC